MRPFSPCPTHALLLHPNLDQVRTWMDLGPDLDLDPGPDLDLDLGPDLDLDLGPDLDLDLGPDLDLDLGTHVLTDCHLHACAQIVSLSASRRFSWGTLMPPSKTRRDGLAQNSPGMRASWCVMTILIVVPNWYR